MILTIDHAAVEGYQDQFIERLFGPLWRRESVWILERSQSCMRPHPRLLRLVASTHDDFAFSHAFRLLSFQELSVF